MFHQSIVPIPFGVFSRSNQFLMDRNKICTIKNAWIGWLGSKYVHNFPVVYLWEKPSSLYMPIHFSFLASTLVSQFLVSPSPVCHSSPNVILVSACSKLFLWVTLLFCAPTAPSMMSLRQRHIDPQLAMGSQRLVESCLALGGQEGEGSLYSSRHRMVLRQARSQSFGQFDALGLPPLSSAVSHPAIYSAASSHTPHSSFATASHASHYHSSHFQPMDTIPDLPYDANSERPHRCGSYGYHFILLCLFCASHLAWSWDFVQNI